MADARCEGCGVTIGPGLLCAACRRLEPGPGDASGAELRASEREIERLAAKVRDELIAVGRCPEPRRCARTIARALLGPWPSDADPVELIRSIAIIDRDRAERVYFSIEGKI